MGGCAAASGNWTSSSSRRGRLPPSPPASAADCNRHRSHLAADHVPLPAESPLTVQIQIASIFLVGCPACNHNFKHFFCLLTCSPDQAAFTNVTAVQRANDTGADNAVAEVDVYVSGDLGEAFYSSCADVVYPALNQKAMKFVGG